MMEKHRAPNTLLPYGISKLTGVDDWAVVEAATGRVVERGLGFHEACEKMAKLNTPSMPERKEWWR